MKVKDVNVSRGRKYSNNYQSVDYHIGITIEGEEEDDIEDMRDYALTNLMAMETQEEIRCSLVIEEVKAEQIADFKKTYNNVTKKIEKDKQFNTETLKRNEEVQRDLDLHKKIDNERFKTKTTEEVLMDLKEVTIIFKTNLSVLVTKKGFQKWVAFSLMDGKTKDDFKISDYLEDIPIREDKRVWFNEKKSWNKLEVAKK